MSQFFPPPPDDLDPLERALLAYHRRNLAQGTYANHGGDLTSVYITGVRGPDGRIYNVPGFYDGQTHSAQDATRHWAGSLSQWPSYPDIGAGDAHPANVGARKVHRAIDADTDLFNRWAKGRPGR